MSIFSLNMPSGRSASSVMMTVPSFLFRMAMIASCTVAEVLTMATSRSLRFAMGWLSMSFLSPMLVAL